MTLTFHCPPVFSSVFKLTLQLPMEYKYIGHRFPIAVILKVDFCIIINSFHPILNIVVVTFLLSYNVLGAGDGTVFVNLVEVGPEGLKRSRNFNL
jgi:hypothetical protein